MKRCKGCGAILQSTDQKALGYAKDLQMDYCERCFRIRNYNDLTIDLKNVIKNEDVLDSVKKENGIIVLIIDVLNCEFSFDDDLIRALKGRRVIVVFSKCDLLMRSLNMPRLENYLKKLVKEKLTSVKIEEILMTSKYDKGLSDFFFGFIDSLDIKRFIFIGYFNAGKSTILNTLMKDDTFTTSYYPSTTTALNLVDVCGYEFIDTPGLIYKDNITSYLQGANLKNVIIKKPIKPKIYQIYEDQSFVIDNLFAVKATPQKNNGSLIFYMNNEISIHRTKTANLQRFLKNSENDCNLLLNEKELSYRLDKDKCEIVINGLGIIGFKAVSRISLISSYDVGIKMRESVF